MTPAPEAEDPDARLQRAQTLAAADLLDEAKEEAMALHREGKLGAARTAYEAILARRPRYPEMLNNLGVLLLQLGDVAAASEVLSRAVAANPALASASSNLGAALKRQGRLAEAITAYRRAIEAEPGMADAHYNLGHALVELQRLPEAIAAYARALDCKPAHRGALCSSIHQRRHLCDWHRFAEDAADLRRLIDEGIPEVTPFDAMIFFDDPALQGACATRMSARQCFGIEPMPARPAERRERIRVGYLSSDFRAHPVSWLMTETLEAHDRSRFECFAYAHGRSGADSPERGRLRLAVEHFRDIDRLGQEEAARAIRADG
ncbi:MAG: tetratricopeptide repeat protein, partial [Gammaproteobacteria bacterium]